MYFSKSRFLSAAVLAGALLGATSLLPAQQYPAPVPDARFSSASASASTSYPTGAAPVSWGGYGYGYYGHTCDAGCYHGHGLIGKSGWVKPKFSLGRWLFCKGYCTHSPDHGWSPPVRRPVYRQSVGYQHYWPSHWYGTPNPHAAAPVTYPMVAIPTDTTQLGYYYQHVPTWHAVPGMIPPAPVPSQYHHRMSAWGHGVAPVGACYPGDWTGTVVPASATPLPVPAEPLPADSPPPAPPETPEDLNNSAMLWRADLPTS